MFSFGNFALLYFSENMQITIAIKKVKMYAILWIFSITSNDRLFFHYYSNYFSSPISEKNDVHMWPIQIMLKWIEIEKVFLRWKYSHCISFTFIFLWGSALQKKIFLISITLLSTVQKILNLFWTKKLLATKFTRLQIYKIL